VVKSVYKSVSYSQVLSCAY